MVHGKLYTAWECEQLDLKLVKKKKKTYPLEEILPLSRFRSTVEIH